MMAMKRKKPENISANSFPFVAGQDNNFFKFEGFQDDDKIALVSVHLEMMQKYINFCKEKDSFKRTSFKEKLSTNFGDYLPSDVVNESCKLVEEKKCMSVESTAISVLQILRVASEKAHEKVPNINIVCENLDVSDNGHSQSKEEINNGIEAKLKPVLALDTPVILPGRDFGADSYFPSQQVPLVPMKPKSKHNQFIVNLHAHVSPSLQPPIENPIKDERKSKFKDLGKLADQMYNRRNVSLVMSKNNSTTAKGEFRLCNCTTC